MELSPHNVRFVPDDITNSLEDFNESEGRPKSCLYLTYQYLHYYIVLMATESI